MTDTGLAKIIVVCGPTAVGKTGFAIKLARRFNGEIVGADSMQIYRRLDIGTAKPTAAEKAVAAHHMVDILDPRDPFDAAAYGRRATACITDLMDRGKVAFVVGGTGLYIKALIYGLTEAAPADETIRNRLKDELGRIGAGAFHERLRAVDSQSADRIHVNDAYRMVRALEVYEITGRPISALHDGHRFGLAKFDVFQIGLTLPRRQLYERIDRRVDMMLAQGLADEVRALLEAGYDPQLKSMQALGYRHMVDCLAGRLTWQEAVETLKRDHRRYAKRQMTWFGADDSVHWFEPHQVQDAANQIQSFLNGKQGYELPG